MYPVVFLYSKSKGENNYYEKDYEATDRKPFGICGIDTHIIKWNACTRCHDQCKSYFRGSYHRRSFGCCWIWSGSSLCIWWQHNKRLGLLWLCYMGRKKIRCGHGTYYIQYRQLLQLGRSNRHQRKQRFTVQQRFQRWHYQAWWCADFL